jgi:glycosyltransferase involved in cell wall biosynthesis
MSTQPDHTAAPSSTTWIALLGRKDEPADGITDYCQQLAASAAKRGIEVRLVRVEWAQQGWPSALKNLLRQSKNWRGVWVLPQYAAMGWSGRGFPVGALLSVAILRLRGARCAMVFHEPWGVGGTGVIGRIRGAFQNWTVRTLYRASEKSIFTIPLSTVPLLANVSDNKSASIPLGPNIPESLTRRIAHAVSANATRTVVVFCVSESPYGEREIADVAGAMRAATTPDLRLRIIFVGRGTSELKNVITEAFAGSNIEVVVRGVCSAPEVTDIFSESDAMLAVRGRLYLRRGSALAGLACGLPILGYGGEASGTILEQGGIALVPFGDREALGLALREILLSPTRWQEMHDKSLALQQKYLSWDVIAKDFDNFLRPAKTSG